MAKFVFVGQPEYVVEHFDKEREVLLRTETRSGDPAPKEVNIWRYSEDDGMDAKLVFVRGEPTEVSNEKVAAKLRRHSHFKEVKEPEVSVDKILEARAAMDQQPVPSDGRTVYPPEVLEAVSKAA